MSVIISFLFAMEVSTFESSADVASVLIDLDDAPHHFPPVFWLHQKTIIRADPMPFIYCFLPHFIYYVVVY